MATDTALEVSALSNEQREQLALEVLSHMGRGEVMGLANKRKHMDLPVRAARAALRKEGYDAGYEEGRKAVWTVCNQEIDGLKAEHANELVILRQNAEGDATAAHRRGVREGRKTGFGRGGLTATLIMAGIYAALKYAGY